MYSRCQRPARESTRLAGLLVRTVPPPRADVNVVLRSMSDGSSIASVRADFPWLIEHAAGRIAADNAATSLKPRAVIDAVSRYLSEYSGNIHRGHHVLSERASEAYERSRQTVARFIGARRAELVFVRGTT